MAGTVKAVVVGTAYSDPAGGLVSRGGEVEVSSDEFDRLSRTDPPILAKASSTEGKSARAETVDAPKTRDGLADPVAEQNPEASIEDLPGLAGDRMRAEGDAPLEGELPDSE
jgi:hypothetical protein